MRRFQLRHWCLHPPTAAIILLVSSGCSDAGQPFSPARGRVLVGDTPATGAIVTLVPAGGASPATELQPSGRVGADGCYTITTYDPKTRTVHNGAPPGQYAATIAWVPEPSRESLARGTPGRDRLGGRYRNPASSPQVEVREGPTELPVIQVKEAATTGRLQ